jgi:hypothetical protein
MREGLRFVLDKKLQIQSVSNSSIFSIFQLFGFYLFPADIFIISRTHNFENEDRNLRVETNH